MNKNGKLQQLIQLWNRRMLVEGASSVFVLVFTLAMVARFLAFVETRPGVVIHDPILSMITPKDFTWVIFLTIYMGLISSILCMLFHPKRLIIALQAYSLVVIFRMMAMYLLPLDPSAGIIILRDPLVEILATGNPLMKDLFFSGHTASMVLVVFAVPNQALKRALMVGTVIVGTCVIVQHVHYAVDVFVAPFIAYASYRIIERLHKVQR